MMHEQRPEQGTQRQGSQLEQRLSAYYGPALKEQPLSQAAWHNLQRKLGSQQQSRKHIDWKHLFRRRRRQPVPEYILMALMHVSHEARMVGELQSASALQCSFRAGVEPTVSLTLRLRPRIHLILPPSAITGMDAAALDTLVATGLARRKLTFRWPALFMRLLAISPALFGLLLLLLWKGMFLLLGIVIVLLLCLLSWILLSRLRRKVLLSSDALAVLWLGRERVCQGLHWLADNQRVPQRSKWGKWGAPSLAERIERVCGTGMMVYDERLTLVR